MTFDRRLANVRTSADFGLYCASSQNLIKILHGVTVNSQG